MSSAICLVRCKKDGAIFIGRYNGTSDCVERYFEDIKNFNDYFELINDIKRREYAKPPFEEEPCEVYSNYGNGFWWNGTFDRNKRVVVKNGILDASWYEITSDYSEVHDEIPDWALEVLDAI